MVKVNPLSSDRGSFNEHGVEPINSEEKPSD